MRKGRLVLLACLCWLLASSPIRAADWVYSVVPGDNLWNLSERYLDSVTRWKALQRLNNISRPKQMPPGSLVRVPMKWIKSNPVPATLHSVNGRVSILRADGSRDDAPSAGSLLQLGDQLITADDSDAVVRFTDDSRLFVRDGSRVRFDHLSAHGKTGMVDSRVNLLNGRTDTQVTPAKGPGSRFEIRSP